MFKKILLPALFTASLLCSIESTAAINLLQYNKISTVSGLVNDKAVTDSLKSTLGQDYEKYISNFDVFGEPHSVPGGGYLLKAGCRIFTWKVPLLWSSIPMGKFMLPGLYLTLMS